MSPPQMLLATAAIAVGALVQGAVGFGSLLVAVPLLVLVDVSLVPGPALVAGLVLALLMAARERRGIDVGSVGWALVGRLPGAVVGALLLGVLPPEDLDLLVAATVLAGVAVTAAGMRLAPSRAALLGAGFVSGVAGTTTSIGGPPIAIVYQHQTGVHLRGTLSGFFVVGSLLSMATLVAVGRFGGADVARSTVLLPGIVAGWAASRPLARRLDRGYTRPAVLVVSAVAAGLLVLRRLG